MEAGLSFRMTTDSLRRAFEGKLVPQDLRDEAAEKLLERIRVGTRPAVPLRSFSRNLAKVLPSWN